jgi:hypothetical protein
MIIQFNGYELKSISESPSAQIVLLYCLIINRIDPLERKLSNNLYLLKEKLNIGFIPNILFTNRFLLNSRLQIFSNYECSEPQSYITNYRFLFDKTNEIDKANYIYMLSLRHMGNRTNTIPLNYLDSTLYANPYIGIRNNKVIFTLENTNDTTSRTRLDSTKETA